MKCKMCSCDKPKSVKMKGVRYIYHNPETDKQWLGKVCPACIPRYFREVVRKPLNLTKSCTVCQKEYKAQRKAQVVCSPECRRKYKSEQELNRQKLYPVK